MFSLRLARSCVQKHAIGRRLLSDASISIPDKSKGWPTPWITEDDATNFLFPLYLYGWYITSVRNDPVRTAGLACRFNFPSFAPAAAFATDIFTVIEAEKHHPSWLNLSHSTKGSSLHICSTTHSALRPAWDVTDTPDSCALEGLTLRDLRFAALVSSLPTSPAHLSNQIEPSTSRPAWPELSAMLRSWSTPTSASATSKQARSKAEKPATCPACAGPHAISKCPTRHSLPAPPCPICNKPHWRVDCPVLKMAQDTGSTVAKTREKLRRMPSDPSYPPSAPPPDPCPNCGGAHWKVDCRVPQAPPQHLERFKLPVPNPAQFDNSKKLV
ncbi:hypothetical protein FB451DRAFT_656893 [Mycena latifolia]|nr:hypothetical protein FB451DRAFT_656893 [Mycena latifolia]